MRVSLTDWERDALALVDDEVAAYWAGAMDERTLHGNVAAFASRRLRPRVLIGNKQADTGITVLGRRWPHPVWLAPTAAHTLAHPDGERATARAAATRDTTWTLATASTTSLDDLAAEFGPWWAQIYPLWDPGARRSLVERVVEAGAEALVLTVDLAEPGRRTVSRRRGFPSKPRRPFPLVADAAGVSLEDSADVAYQESVDLGDVSWLAGFGLPVLVKGVLRGDDARRAVDAGANGVVVSNHGGRQLDGAMAALDALPDVLDAVGADVPVLVDGGARRGSDVLVALAMGATAVGIGRPVLWGLAVDGEAGVGAVIDLLVDELRHVMRLAGTATVADITGDLLQEAARAEE